MLASAKPASAAACPPGVLLGGLALSSLPSDAKRESGEERASASAAALLEVAETVVAAADVALTGGDVAPAVPDAALPVDG